jgi:tetratricopeptide (TPR) repeat protein
VLLLETPEAQEPRLAERPASWLLVGRAWFRSGEPARGAPFLARFVELAPRDREASSALHLLAQAALGRGDGPTAEACVRRAEELSRWHALWKVRARQVHEKPAEALPRIGLAQLWLQAGDTQRARAQLNDLLARHADSAQGWFLLGEAQRMERDLEGALASYSKALETEPQHLLALNNRATIHRLAGRLAEARADFERVVDGPRGSEPAALPAQLALARTLATLGDESAAQKRYARYVELGGREPLVEPRR